MGGDSAEKVVGSVRGGVADIPLDEALSMIQSKAGDLATRVVISQSTTTESTRTVGSDGSKARWIPMPGRSTWRVRVYMAGGGSMHQDNSTLRGATEPILRGIDSEHAAIKKEAEKGKQG